MSDYMTMASNALLVLTLIYCVILERRIRSFRREAIMFQSLLAELTRSTESAQTVITALRVTLNDAKAVITRDGSTSHNSSPSARPLENTQSKMPPAQSTMSAKDLAQYFAERRLFTPLMAGDRE